MRVLNNNIKSEFTPIVLTVTIETQAEYNALRESYICLDAEDITTKITRDSRVELVRMLDAISSSMTLDL